MEQGLEHRDKRYNMMKSLLKDFKYEYVSIYESMVN